VSGANRIKKNDTYAENDIKKKKLILWKKIIIVNKRLIVLQVKVEGILIKKITTTC